MTDSFLEAARHLPVMARFAIAMMVLFVVPHLCRRVKLPAVVGLIAAGMLLGPYGLSITPQSRPVAEFFSELGKLLLMFFAGLEIDLELFRRMKKASSLFGLLTFLLPLGVGFFATRAFGYSPLASLLVGSLLASHTLLGFPIIQKAGLAGSEAVTITVGATVFTDIAALLTLAVCIPIHQSGFSPGSFLIQLAVVGLFAAIVLVGFSRLGRRIVNRTQDSPEMQLTFMLLIVGVVAVGAEAIHLEGIIGAFLAGLAVNDSMRKSKAREPLEFFGNSLFIPIFFMTIGFIIDMRVFASTLFAHFPLVVAIVGGLIVSKLGAAFLYGWLRGYSRTTAWLMGSLTLPQVAATLAAALVARKALNPQGQPLIDEPILNTVLVMLVVTSTIGPILTESKARALQQTPAQ